MSIILCLYDIRWISRLSIGIDIDHSTGEDMSVVVDNPVDDLCICFNVLHVGNGNITRQQHNQWVYQKTQCIWASLWENRLFAYAKTKTQISFAVTAKLISAFVFAIRIVQTLYFLNPKFQASSHLLWLHIPVCVGPGRKPRRPVFSERGSYLNKTKWVVSWENMHSLHACR